MLSDPRFWSTVTLVFASASLFAASMSLYYAVKALRGARRGKE